MRPVLSARQEECLRLTAFHTDREIAAVLGISEPTVKKHVHEACQRLGVKRRKAALSLLLPGQGPAVAPREIPAPLEPATEVKTTDVAEAAARPPEPPAVAAIPAAARIGRLGYRPPPRNLAARVMIIAGLAVVLVATTTTVTHMVVDYHLVIGKMNPQMAMTRSANARAFGVHR